MIAAWQSYVADTIAASPNASLQPACVPRHYAPTANSSRGVVVLFHGFSACPQQYDVLGPLIAAEGFDVLLPLTPGHGNALNMSRVHGVCITGCDGGIDDVSGLPTDPTGYEHFVDRINGIAALSSGLRAVGGIMNACSVRSSACTV